MKWGSTWCVLCTWRRAAGWGLCWERSVGRRGLDPPAAPRHRSRQSAPERSHCSTAATGPPAPGPAHTTPDLDLDSTWKLPFNWTHMFNNSFSQDKECAEFPACLVLQSMFRLKNMVFSTRKVHKGTVQNSSRSVCNDQPLMVICCNAF